MSVGGGEVVHTAVEHDAGTPTADFAAETESTGLGYRVMEQFMDDHEKMFFPR